MNLRVIERHEDKTNEAYNSSECQQLLEAYEDFYPKIGFDKNFGKNRFRL